MAPKLRPLKDTRNHHGDQGREGPISGAGSAILALAAGAEAAVAQALQQEAQAVGLTGRTFVVDLWEKGAEVLGAATA